jgi:hypothetical protein
VRWGAGRRGQGEGWGAATGGGVRGWEATTVEDETGGVANERGAQNEGGRGATLTNHFLALQERLEPLDMRAARVRAKQEAAAFFAGGGGWQEAKRI